MPGLKNRYLDQSKRLISRHMRLEICAVDEVEWHKEPNDHRFNTVTVVMRDRAKKVDSSKSYYRAKLPVLQHFEGGNHLGGNFNPRKGDLVYVLFYKEREGIVLGNAWSWAEYPICRPSPYDIAIKGGQWPEPYQDGCGDFPRQPYPSGKKPFCFRWWHGPVTGLTGKGRDWAWMLDYCHMGDATPSCKDCKNIDSVCRSDNHGFKFYSSETESKVSHPDRGEYFAPCGSYWMFESKCCGDCEECTESCCSEMFTEGMGFWTIQGATAVGALKGHLRHSPPGSMDIHSTTEAATLADESTGTRVAVIAPDDATVNFAWQIKDFVKNAYAQALKTGKIEIVSPTEILLQAPLITLDGDVVITGNLQVPTIEVGACAHGSCSCEGAGAGGASGTGTGTGAQQTIPHGIVDSAGEACCPGSASASCPGGGSCTITGCDQVNLYIVADLDADYEWVCGPAEDGWGGWEPCF